MITTLTNHGSEIPLPDHRALGTTYIVEQALREARDHYRGHIYVVWARDVEDAIVDEQRERYHRTESVDLDSAVKARGVTFISDLRIPRGTVFVSPYDPAPILDQQHLTTGYVVDTIRALSMEYAV